MSSAPGSILPELLASAESRSARHGRAWLLLDAGLTRILLGDAAGRRAFGLGADGETLPPLLARQLRSSARRVAEGGAVSVLLSVAAGRSLHPLAAMLIGLSDGETRAALLTAPLAPGDTQPDPRGRLADLGLSAAPAALFDAGGRIAAGTGLAATAPAEDEALAGEARALLAEDGSERRFATQSSDVRLLRIENDLVLALFSARSERPAEVPPAPPGEANPEIPAQPAAPNIAAMVERWQGRREGDGPADPADPASGLKQPLRSLWGAPASVASGDAPSENRPATPTEDPEAPRAPQEQPTDQPHVVTLPDLPEDAAEEIEAPLVENEERPEAEELVPGTEERSVPAQPTETAAAAPPAAARTTPSGFVPDFSRAPMRFVWQIDRDGRFRSLSPEFAGVVGPRAADVIGRSFVDVATAFDLDASGEIRRLLDRRDTWSGRTITWPVEGTDRRVPIDLAALPTYARDRSFDGFRGFGILRATDAEKDPQAIGLALAMGDPFAVRPGEPAPPPAPPVIESPATGLTLRSFEAELPGVSFGRRQAPPAPADAGEPKVVRLGERRRAREGMLSETEEAAFRAIGAKLGEDAGAEIPPALRIADPSPDAEAGAAAPEAGAALRPSADETNILGALALPLLVQGRDEIVYANAAFLEMAGHADIAALNAAGGLDALFAERPEETEGAEMALRRADGATVPARVRMQRISFGGRSSLLMTFEPAPRPAEAEAEVEDRTEAEDLRRGIAELRAVLDIATDGVILVDAEAQIRTVNGSAQALFGQEPEAMEGKPLASLFAGDSQRAVQDYLESLKDKGIAAVLNDGREVTGRVAQGGLIPLFITIGPLSEGRGWCVVIRDIAHWKRVEEDLVNARRAAEAASLHKSRFLANITHELRTPLNAIIGFADVMASECFGPIGNERYLEYLGDIKRSGHHVLDLVNDLLDISKIEAGKMELTFEPVSLNEVLAEVVSVMQPQANRERVIVRSNLPPSVPQVVADRRTIRQIALNLLSNSVRFTPAGGQIIASTAYTAEGDVLLRVRDSGIGMTEREIEIALTPFQQVHQPGEERGQGTGLGLPLTKAMAEANRARFTIRSTPGEGTLVEIAFPAQRVLVD
ncbi:PAS domain-containing sensor histidine kinase [Aureimonas endophytica]|uniref:histidine kinase n=1 Tax=Aureimonas endophytica TaxID=2027858 RepID=A0A916ZH00_9HYPH|nr:PAS domain S-box protein [Aureimonas endophytica]GGD97367.1 PAS domain-containing sensor histidine kinase [Aureimonas endophytica]